MLSDDDLKIRTIYISKPNCRMKKFMICCKREVPAFKGNQITTSKYNFLTFLPLNLMLQFSKFANLYFLILTVMECFPLISDSGGVPVLLLPLSFVVGVSMIKDIYEDYIRHKSDNEENNREVEVGDNGKFRQVRWRDIRVGQVVKVYENQFFPCDMIILNSSLPKGICYVETKNLDGETNLKQKQANKEIAGLSQDQRGVMKNFK
jgi:phospholipid-transporting ATPase